MKRSIIKSTGRFVPDNHVSNDDLAKILDTSDEWIRQRTGIEARYWVKEGDDVGTSVSTGSITDRSGESRLGAH